MKTESPCAMDMFNFKTLSKPRIAFKRQMERNLETVQLWLRSSRIGMPGTQSPKNRICL